SVHVGDWLSSNQRIGEVSILGARHELLVPESVSGRVNTLHAKERGRGREYGEALLDVQTVTDAGSAGIALSAEEQHAGEPYVAPMDGQFYRRPSPDELDFVSPGQAIQPGQTIGLIEVMKFFYPIVWEGTEPRTLLSWTADEGPVESGEELLRWE
ncbi:MAG: acetyl-CoA carboxylase biotin carboxyl carrier protein, partial [Flavobacteriales bacterium]